MEIENLLAAASFEPLSVQFPDSWVGHTPFAFWLIKEIQPKVFVELGVHSGNSYFAFCQAIKEGRFQTKSYAIDRWTGDEHSGVYDDKVFEYVNDHNQNHYSAFSTLMRMDFDEAAREFSSNSIDLLHIDGFHSYEAVRHDFETWLPKLSSQGIVIFHDINVHLPDFGVYKFWEELKLRYSNTIEFMHSNGLGVLFLLEGPEKNLILPFLKQSKMEHKLFISYFSQLGERQFEKYKLRHRESEFKILSDESGIQRQTIASQVNEIERINNEWLLAMGEISQRNGVIEKITQDCQSARSDLEIAMVSLGELNDQLLVLQNINQNLATSLDDLKSQIRRIHDSFGGIIIVKLNSLNAAIKNLMGRLNLGKQKKEKKIRPSLKLEGFNIADPKDFDSDLYLILNPDVLEAGVDPVLHFKNHGCMEGRPHSLPAVFGDEIFSKTKEVVLIVAHEATRTGAPILAVNILKELAKIYNVVTVLLGDGPLLREFQKYGATVTFVKNSHGLVIDESLRRLCHKYQFKFAIVNSVESRSTLKALSGCFIPTISLFHEFASWTSAEAAFVEAFFWSNESVFSSTVTQKNVIEFNPMHPELIYCKQHVIPQGKCEVPGAELTHPDDPLGPKKFKELIRPSLLPSDVKVILGAGYVQFRKGVDLFLECAAKVIATPGGEKYRFVWVGGGYDPEKDMAYSRFLQDQLRRAGLEKQVFFVDESPYINIAYEEADLFLVTSRLDPLPNVAIDAMFHKLPVLCFDKTTGIADFLKENGLGETCVAEYLDVDGLAMRVVNVFSGNDLYCSAAEICFKAANHSFDMKGYVSNLINLGLNSRNNVNQERLDFDDIFNSKTLDYAFSRMPHEGERGELVDRLRSYVRSWSNGISRRKPFPGFHPGIYLEQHGVRTPASDPFADFIRNGMPLGSWMYPVIKSGQPIIVENIPTNESVALHIHVFYPELLPEIMLHLGFNSIKPDLFISVPSERVKDQVIDMLKSYQGNLIEIEVVPNRGRDIGPLLTLFGQTILRHYKFVGHIHTKKTKDIKDRALIERWREFLLVNLLGNASFEMADAILSELNSNSDMGIIFPDDPNAIGWDKNKKYAIELSKQLGINDLPENFIFPVGTMFWAKTKAIEGMVNRAFKWEEYPEEPLPYDGSMLHALERLLGFPSNGLKVGAAWMEGSTR